VKHKYQASGNLRFRAAVAAVNEPSCPLSSAPESLSVYVHEHILADIEPQG